MTTQAEFTDWLLDTSRNNYRALLIDIEHVSGVVRLGSLPYQSEFYEAHDEWLIGQPVIANSLEDFLGAGDIDAVNLDPDVDWLSLQFRGQYCRWYYGDVEWSKSDFVPVAIAIVDNCRNITENQYRFDLFDAGQFLTQEFIIASQATTRTETVESAFTFITTEAQISNVTYVNVDASYKAFSVTYSINENTLLDDILTQLATSIGAYLRVTPLGVVEVVRPDYGDVNALQITEDSIADTGVEIIDTIPPYRRVTVKRHDGSIVSLPTNSDTGVLNETLTIETLLNNATDATTLLNEKVTFHSVGHDVWRVPIHDKGHQVQVGDAVDLSHYQVTGTGVVFEMRRSPMEDFSDIEVVI